LFPPVKDKADSIQNHQEHQFFERLHDILGDIDHDELNQIFRA
jgi:hypothetical protein